MAVALDECFGAVRHPGLLIFPVRALMADKRINRKLAAILAAM